MTKAGDEYQSVVAAVAKAVHPHATVTDGEWIVGPDGRRDMDVAIRTPSPMVRLILLECKDWDRPVGIGAIDALESKRKDLGAANALMYSNSGFTKQALRKAARVGIGALSALRASDGIIKLRLQRDWVAKRLSVSRWFWIFYPASEELDATDVGAADITYNGEAVVNWAHEVSMRLLREYEGVDQFKYLLAFREPLDFVISHRLVRLKGLGFLAYCRRTWLSQTVQIDVSLGYYDHLAGRVVIPNGEAYILGPVDPHRWEPLDDGWAEDAEPEPGTFDLRITFLNPIHTLDGPTPNLDPFVLEREIKTSPPWPEGSNLRMRPPALRTAAYPRR